MADLPPIPAPSLDPADPADLTPQTPILTIVNDELVLSNVVDLALQGQPGDDGDNGDDGDDGDDGADGISIVGVTVDGNPDGSIDLNFQRDQGQPDLSVTTPVLTGDDGDDGNDGVSVTGVSATEDPATGLTGVTFSFSSGPDQTLAGLFMQPVYFKVQNSARVEYPSGTNEAPQDHLTLNVSGLPAGEYEAIATWGHGVEGTGSDFQARILRAGVAVSLQHNEESQDASLGDDDAEQRLHRTIRYLFTVPAGGVGPEEWIFQVERRTGTTDVDIAVANASLTIERKSGL